jgi:hypothetical protein
MLQEEDNGIDLGEYGLGTERSHHDYELYAGIDFGTRKLHPDAKKGIDPPTTVDGASWEEIFPETFTLNLDWTDRWKEIRSQVDCSCTIQFIYVGVEDSSGEVLFRSDLTDAEYLSGKERKMDVVLPSSSKPTKLVVWPYEKDKGWLNRVDINL